MARGLRGIGGAPERPRIDPVRIKGKHSIVEFQSCACFIIQANEILDVAQRFLDVPRGIVRLHRAVADHDGTRIKRPDLIDGGEPVRAAPDGLIRRGTDACRYGKIRGGRAILYFELNDRFWREAAVQPEPQI
jgi:hypothetical protein